LTYLVIIAAITFTGVTLIVLGLSLLMRNKPTNRIEDRLGLLTGKINPRPGRSRLRKAFWPNRWTIRPAYLSVLSNISGT